MRSLEGKCSRVVVFLVLSGDRRRCFESSAPPESKTQESASPDMFPILPKIPDMFPILSKNPNMFPIKSQYVPDHE